MTDEPVVEAPKVLPVNQHAPHLLRLYVDGEDIGYDIECPYPPDDPARPCRMFADYYDTDEPTNLIDGCGVRDHIDGGGYEAVEITGRIQAPPIMMTVAFDEYPKLREWDGPAV